MLERREIVGGCAVTEEFAPGLRVDRRLRAQHAPRAGVARPAPGRARVTVDPAGPALNLYADGSALLLDDDLAVAREQVAGFSGADARALPEFEAELGRIAELITPLIDTTPPDPRRCAADIRG